MSETVRKLAGEQRKRLVGGILGHAERTFYDRLSRTEQREFRQVVLASAAAYHDFILDVIKVGREDAVRNEAAIDLLQAVHDSQRRLERTFGDH